MSSKAHPEPNQRIPGFDFLNRIKEVFSDNFEEELDKISELIVNYPIISMDTEFPGVVVNSAGGFIGKSVSEGNYFQIKQNVDILKVIQIGITLANAEGLSPPGTSTWQFNFDFNLLKEKNNPESISLLIESGIDFPTLEKRGISLSFFAEKLLTSGLVLNEDVTWVTFHGSYDLAYLLKILTGLALPTRLDGFFSELEMYFKNFYDVKFLVKDDFSNYKLSLNKLANDLDIERIGSQHQAGSDSRVTSDVFFKAKKMVISTQSMLNGRNKLYCLSNECAEESYALEGTYMGGYNPYSYGNMVGYHGYEGGFLMNSMNGLNNMSNMNSMNYHQQQYYNMLITNNGQGKGNFMVPSVSEFNSGSSTASGGSFTQQVSIVKKKKSKKDKKKKAQKKANLATTSSATAEPTPNEAD